MQPPGGPHRASTRVEVTPGGSPRQPPDRPAAARRGRPRTSGRRRERRRTGERTKRGRGEAEDAPTRPAASPRPAHAEAGVTPNSGNESSSRSRTAARSAHRRVEVGQTDRQRRQVTGQLGAARSSVEVDQRQQRRGIPAQVRAGGEQGPFPRPPLREPDHLAAAVEHLARARGRRSTPGRRAHPGTERPRWTSKPCCPEPGQRLHPPRPDPLGGGGHVGAARAGRPAGSRRRPRAARPARDRRLLPRRAAGPAPPRAPAWRATSTSSVRLGAAEHQRRPGHVTGDRQPPRLGAELLDVEEGRGTAGNLRRPRRDTAPTAGPHPTGGATARGARRAAPASRAASSPARRGAGRP